MTGAKMRTLALCADDFGLAPGISRGIAELAQRERLNAVSCLANAAHWPSDAGADPGAEPEVVGAQREDARHGAGSPIAPRPASLPIRYTGRCLTSSKMRPTYSPRMPIDSSCTPLKNIIPHTSVAQPGTSVP